MGRSSGKRVTKNTLTRRARSAIKGDLSEFNVLSLDSGKMSQLLHRLDNIDPEKARLIRAKLSSHLKSVVDSGKIALLSAVSESSNHSDFDYLFKKARKKNLAGERPENSLNAVRFNNNLKILKKYPNQQSRALVDFFENISRNDIDNYNFLNSVIESIILSGENKGMALAYSQLKEVEPVIRREASVGEAQATDPVFLIPSFSMIENINSDNVLSGAQGYYFSFAGQGFVLLSCQKALARAMEIQLPEIDHSFDIDQAPVANNANIREAFSDTLRHELIHSTQKINKVSDPSQFEREVIEGLTESLNSARSISYRKNLSYAGEVKKINQLIKIDDPENKELFLDHLNSLSFKEAAERLDEIAKNLGHESFERYWKEQ